METGGDARYGLLIAGGVLVVLGWGAMLALNLLLHRLAGSGGVDLGAFRVYSTVGPFAQASAILGAAVGLVGVVIVYYGWTSPTGPFVLPGTSY